MYLCKSPWGSDNKLPNVQCTFWILISTHSAYLSTMDKQSPTIMFHFWYLEEGVWLSKKVLQLSKKKHGTLINILTLYNFQQWFVRVAMKIKFMNTVLSFFIPQGSLYLAFLSQVKWPCRLGGGGGRLGTPT